MIIFRHGEIDMNSVAASFELAAVSAKRCAEALERLAGSLRWRRFDIIYGPWIGAAVILVSLALAWAGAAWGTR